MSKANRNRATKPSTVNPSPVMEGTEQPGKPSVDAVRDRLGLTDEPATVTVSGDRSRLAAAIHKAADTVGSDVTGPIAAAIDAIARLDVSADVKADLVKAALASAAPRPIGNARRHRSNLNYVADPIRFKAPRPGSKRHGVMMLLSTTPSTLDEVAQHINANYAFANAWNRTTAREGVSLLATVHGYGLATDASGRTTLISPWVTPVADTRGPLEKVCESAGLLKPDLRQWTEAEKAAIAAKPVDNESAK